MGWVWLRLRLHILVQPVSAIPMTFDELALAPRPVALPARSAGKPTPFSSLAIPAALSGRDLLALARTGSGKTLAFGLPLLQRLDAASDRVQGLVLVPTRAGKPGERRPAGDCRRVGVRPDPVWRGGPGVAGAGNWLSAPTAGGDPGRLRDLLAQQTLGLGALRMLVLDEADRLLEMGFWPDIQWLMKAMPEARQHAVLRHPCRSSWRAWPRACCRIRCVSRPSRSTAW